ncbi:hypothetical protein CBR_g39141 [Chara braunii]|uniref:DNA (cytosine-5-)-methyltransferase n=1 Tax=Chara braunii TaxID=69332 RepID=A0A388LR23_CHABU|nr:hypothetical protein CBR_g39141 [Chara braunii]|eukprot:GBG84764.1 hypothetical protein CBR_g39141 [Chara braunii]
MLEACSALGREKKGEELLLSSRHVSLASISRSIFLPALLWASDITKEDQSRSNEGPALLMSTEEGRYIMYGQDEDLDPVVLVLHEQLVEILREQLVEMGFARSTAESAIAACGPSLTLEACVEEIFRKEENLAAKESQNLRSSEPGPSRGTDSGPRHHQLQRRPGCVPILERDPNESDGLPDESKAEPAGQSAPGHARSSNLLATGDCPAGTALRCPAGTALNEPGRPSAAANCPSSTAFDEPRHPSFAADRCLGSSKAVLDGQLAAADGRPGSLKAVPAGQRRAVLAGQSVDANGWPDSSVPVGQSKAVPAGQSKAAADRRPGSLKAVPTVQSAVAGGRPGSSKAVPRQSKARPAGQSVAASRRPGSFKAVPAGQLAAADGHPGSLKAVRRQSKAIPAGQSAAAAGRPGSLKAVPAAQSAAADGRPGSSKAVPRQSKAVPAGQSAAGGAGLGEGDERSGHHADVDAGPHKETGAKGVPRCSDGRLAWDFDDCGCLLSTDDDSGNQSPRSGEMLSEELECHRQKGADSNADKVFTTDRSEICQARSHKGVGGIQMDTGDSCALGNLRRRNLRPKRRRPKTSSLSATAPPEVALSIDPDPSRGKRPCLVSDGEVEDDDGDLDDDDDEEEEEEEEEEESNELDEKEEEDSDEFGDNKDSNEFDDDDDDTFAKWETCHFYFENVSKAPKGTWEEIATFLHEHPFEKVNSNAYCAARRERCYVHNLPMVGRIEHKSPYMTIKAIMEAQGPGMKFWPGWDTRQQFRCLGTKKCTLKKAKQLSRDLLRANDDSGLQDLLARNNLVWMRPKTLIPLSPEQMELVMGYPALHTASMTPLKRYAALGNAFQVHTVATHFSPLKAKFPDGIRVLSLFDGIGGCALALDMAGVYIKVYIAVEIDEDCRDIVRNWWSEREWPEKQLIQDWSDVTKFKRKAIEDIFKRCGGIDLVVGGSPCGNLTGSNRQPSNSPNGRCGLQGLKSKLFYHFHRILERVSTMHYRRALTDSKKQVTQLQSELMRLKGSGSRSTEVAYEVRTMPGGSKDLHR